MKTSSKNKMRPLAKLFLVAGARPNFMKIAPIIHALKRTSERHRRGFSWSLVHTGQHYDYAMSKVFFHELEIPKPDYFLKAGSGTHAGQTAKIMVEFEKVCLKNRPDMVIVVGDVNSTLACSITAKKLDIKVAHVEAGLRSGDMTMPEEINRIVTDSISDLFFVTEKSGIENLKKEGNKSGKTHFVGNVMIDTLHHSLKKLGKHKQNGLSEKYAVVTLHRPSNVDTREHLEEILTALNIISEDMRIYFPIHPRTLANIKRFGLSHLLASPRIEVMTPKPYLEFLELWSNAALVLTDSGGIQEETTALGIPCFTLRNNTERPITIEEGTNTLVGTTKKKILKCYNEFKRGKKKNGRVPALWDGKSSERIVDALANYFDRAPQ